MKEIRLCDNGEIEYTLELCKKNNLAIEVQSFYNPYLENKHDIIEEYKKLLPEVKIGRSYHAPFWDLNLGSKNLLVKNATMNSILNFIISFLLGVVVFFIIEYIISEIKIRKYNKTSKK